MIVGTLTAAVYTTCSPIQNGGLKRILYPVKYKLYPGSANSVYKRMTVNVTVSICCRLWQTVCLSQGIYLGVIFDTDGE